MSNFKVGDKVDRVVALPTFKILEGGGPYTVTAVSPSAHFIQINLNTHYGDHYPWDARNFKLVEQDDPLPPAPESVLYREAVTGNTLSARTREWDNTVEVWSGDRVGSICLSADEAMQLAHNLTRMAMEIKRKEKQND